MVTINLSSLKKEALGVTQNFAINGFGAVARDLQIDVKQKSHAFSTAYAASIVSTHLLPCATGVFNPLDAVEYLQNMAREKKLSFSTIADQFYNLIEELSDNRAVWLDIISMIAPIPNRGIVVSRAPIVMHNMVVEKIKNLKNDVNFDASKYEDEIINVFADYLCTLWTPLRLVVDSKPYVYAKKVHSLFPKYNDLIDVVEANRLLAQMMLLSSFKLDTNALGKISDVGGLNAIPVEAMINAIQTNLYSASLAMKNGYDPIRVVNTVLALLSIRYESNNIDVRDHELLRIPGLEDLEQNITLFNIVNESVDKGYMSIHYPVSVLPTIITVFKKAMAENSPFLLRSLDEITSYYSMSKLNDHRGEFNFANIDERIDAKNTALVVEKIARGSKNSDHVIRIEQHSSQSLASLLSSVSSLCSVADNNRNRKLIQASIDTSVPAHKMFQGSMTLNIESPILNRNSIRNEDNLALLLNSIYNPLITSTKDSGEKGIIEVDVDIESTVDKKKVKEKRKFEENVVTIDLGLDDESLDDKRKIVASMRNDYYSIIQILAINRNTSNFKVYVSAVANSKAIPITGSTSKISDFKEVDKDGNEVTVALQAEGGYLQNENEKEPRTFIKQNISLTGRKHALVWMGETKYRRSIGSSSSLDGHVKSLEPLEVLCYLPSWESLSSYTPNPIDIGRFERNIYKVGIDSELYRLKLEQKITVNSSEQSSDAVKYSVSIDQGCVIPALRSKKELYAYVPSAVVNSFNSQMLSFIDNMELVDKVMSSKGISSHSKDAVRFMAESMCHKAAVDLYKMAWTDQGRMLHDYIEQVVVCSQLDADSYDDSMFNEITMKDIDLCVKISIYLCKLVGISPTVLVKYHDTIKKYNGFKRLMSTELNSKNSIM